MKILVALPSVVSVCKDGCYNNTVGNIIKRYSEFGDLSIMAFSKVSPVTISEMSKLNSENVSFVFRKKRNTIFSYFKYGKENKKIERDAILEADCCIFHVPIADDAYLIETACSLNKPYLVVVCGCAWNAFWHHSIKGKFVAFFRYYYLKQVIRKSSYVIYVTDKYLQGKYVTKGDVLGCSNVMLPDIDCAILQKRQNMISCINSMKELKIITIGAIDVTYKGQKSVIKAIALAKKVGFNFQYYLVGKGSSDFLHKIARQYGVEDNIHFVGGVPHNQIFDYLDSMDVYIQPSKTEGLPRAVIEALSRGLLCLGSDAGGIPELISSKYIFKKGDASSIRNLLVDITKEQMLEQAEINIQKATGFTEQVLNKKRMDFIMKFLINNKLK